MSTTIRLDYAQLPPGLNGAGGIKRMHYRTYTKLRNMWTALVDEERRNLAQVELPVERCAVEVAYRVIQDNDWDGLYARCKILLDALVAGGILKDDGPKVITDLHCTQQKVHHRNEVGLTVFIRIEETK